MRKTVLITGSSSGIGQACAEKFAKNGFRVILNGRREGRLKQLSDYLMATYQTEVFNLVFDVRNKKQVYAAIERLPEAWRQIDILINNAGLALGLSNIDSGLEEDWEQMIDTNVKGLLYVSKAVMQDMIRRKNGHILNIGSIAGRQTYLKGNVYCATKHAVESITEAMRMELVSDNIKVTLLSPGAVKTEFSEVRFKGDKEKAEKVYEGFQPLTPEDIAECALFCANLPEHVNVNDMLIMPTAQANATIFNKT
ncbi:MAG: SDR family NAD(P)-dependent oxidoreductase [Bacteroidales bacterium]